MHKAEKIAAAFHEAYERLAPEYGYKTRETSAVPWKDVPEANRNLMIAVVADLLERDVIPTEYGGDSPLNMQRASSWHQ